MKQEFDQLKSQYESMGSANYHATNADPSQIMESSIFRSYPEIPLLNLGKVDVVPGEAVGPGDHAPQNDWEADLDINVDDELFAPNQVEDGKSPKEAVGSNTIGAQLVPSHPEEMHS